MQTCVTLMQKVIILLEINEVMLPNVSIKFDLRDLINCSSCVLISVFLLFLWQLVNTGKERAQVSLLLTWAVSGSTLLVVANCDYVRFSKILWDYSIFSHNYLFYTEFNWRCLTPIRRSRERTIYVSIYHSISFSFHILVVLQLIFNPYLSSF